MANQTTSPVAATDELIWQMALAVLAEAPDSDDEYIGLQTLIEMTVDAFAIGAPPDQVPPVSRVAGLLSAALPSFLQQRPDLLLQSTSPSGEPQYRWAGPSDGDWPMPISRQVQ